MKRTLLAAVLLASLAAAGAAQAGGDAAAGKSKSAPCAKCHGPNGEGKGKYPAIAGLAEGEFVQMLEDYKSGKKKNGMMKSYAGKLSLRGANELHVNGCAGVLCGGEIWRKVGR